MTKRDEKSRTARGKVSAAKAATPKPRKAQPGTARPPKRVATSKATTARTVRAAEVDPTGHSEARQTAGTHEVAAPVNPPAPAAPGWSWTSTGVRLDLDALTIDAEQAQVENGALKTVVSLRRGDHLLYAERVNLDWVGGRDKFLRKAARALAQAGVATELNEAFLAEMRAAIRARPEKPPVHRDTARR